MKFFPKCDPHLNQRDWFFQLGLSVDFAMTYLKFFPYVTYMTKSFNGPIMALDIRFMHMQAQVSKDLANFSAPVVVFCAAQRVR